jgi:hypothetical protein
MGILLGLARWVTGFIYVTFAMHFLWNLIAVIEVAAMVGK